MPYDANLDECLFSKSWENDFQRLTVNIYCYNQGDKKIQIAREAKNREGDFKFTKLGRLTKEEAQAVLPLLQEAIEKMD
jgi:uncharacterized lipoprotein YehR (DUF1307 family)